MPGLILAEDDIVFGDPARISLEALCQLPKTPFVCWLQTTECLLLQSVGEQRNQYLARCHAKFSVVNLAESRSMPVDNDVVGRIGDHKIGFCAVHDALIAGCDQRVAAEYAVPAIFKQAACSELLRVL